jgi:hypothetical protein
MFAAEGRGEIPKGTAERWARHTKNIKSLPEKKKKKEEDNVKKSELVLQKYASLICSLPERKRNAVMAQLVYPTQDTPLSKMASVLAALPDNVQIKLATLAITSKRSGSFIKQSAEVMLWREKIAQIPNMTKLEKRAFWNLLAPAAGWIGRDALPWLGKQVGSVGKWLGGGKGGILGNAGQWLGGDASKYMSGLGKDFAGRGLEGAIATAAGQGMRLPNQMKSWQAP